MASHDDWKRKAAAAGFTPEQIEFLLTFGIPHTHGPDTVFVDDKITLDEWGDSVEERLEGAEDDDEEEDDGGVN